MNDTERDLLLAREYEHLEKLSKTIDPPKKPRLGTVLHWLFWFACMGALAFGIQFYFHTTDFAILSLATILCVASGIFSCIFFYAIFIQYFMNRKDYNLYLNNPRDYCMKKAFEMLMDEKVKEQIVYELSHGIGVEKDRWMGVMYYGGMPNGRIKSGEM